MVMLNEPQLMKAGMPHTLYTGTVVFGSGKVDFLDIQFSLAKREDWLTLILNEGQSPFSYIVTPNVDHIVNIARNPDIHSAYKNADWRICDSRILEKLAQRRGIDLMTYPGASMVNDLLRDTRSRDLRIAIVGPGLRDFEILQARFPHHNFVHIDAPMMNVGSLEWQHVLQAVEKADADISVLCISFPKQEMLAQDLKLRGKARGIGLCAGASIDFLTGRQKRAPQILQKLGMEWAYRLLSNPKRLWKRYLVDGPKIFSLYLKDRKR